MNSLAYASNSAASQFMGSGGPGLSIASYVPRTGAAGTGVQVKISSPFDITTMSTPAPFASVLFGAQKCHANMIKEGVAPDGCTYTFLVSAQAPEFLVTSCRSAIDVPLGLLIESASGEELARIDSVGTFTYQDAGSVPGAGVGVARDASAHEDITRKTSRSPEQRESPPQLTIRTSVTNSPVQPQHPLSADSTTNTYGYPSAASGAAAADDAASAAAQAHHNDFAAAASFNQDNNMLGTYRSTSFTDHYPRSAPPILRTPGWAPYGAAGTGGGLSGLSSLQRHHDHRYGSRRSAAAIAHHSAITRPSLTPSLPSAHPSTPQLIRTSTLQSAPPGSAAASSSYNNPWALYSTKAVLTITGSLDLMARDWTAEEWHNKRRIVVFRKKQTGSHIEINFYAVPVSERPPNSICVSCIYWADKNECFVTSVDTIHLLEQLVVAPSKFSVEEKNRIRRNLEGFKPLTVSKAKSDSEDFFKTIMGFGNPKPRNIEKDVKVFPWKVLGQALKKIISKYSANPSTTAMAPTTPTHMLTPISMAAPYPGLPPTPGSTTTATDAVTASGYVSLTAPHQSDSIPSPRSLTGAPPPSTSWAVTYPTTTTRPLSPRHSPQQSALRISTLPTYDTRSPTYDTRSPHSAAMAVSSSYALSIPAHAGVGGGGSNGGSSGSHHLSAAMPVAQSHSAHSSRWDSYEVGAGTNAYSGHHHHTHSQVYGSGYGDGTSRA